MIARAVAGLVLAVFPSGSLSAGVQIGASSASQSCRPAPPARSRVLEISDRVILARVTRVRREATPKPGAGEPRLERGDFDLTPVKALKGEPSGPVLTLRYDATLHPDLFGGAPCRWSPQPMEGEVWLVAASRDGEDCATCDGRLDATHRLDYLAPEGWFGPSR